MPELPISEGLRAQEVANTVFVSITPLKSALPVSLLGYVNFGPYEKAMQPKDGKPARRLKLMSDPTIAGELLLPISPVTQNSKFLTSSEQDRLITLLAEKNRPAVQALERASTIEQTLGLQEPENMTEIIDNSGNRFVKEIVHDEEGKTVAISLRKIYSPSSLHSNKGRNLKLTARSLIKELSTFYPNLNLNEQKLD